TPIIEPVMTTAITPPLDANGNCLDASDCYIGFQGSFAYDSAIVDFPPGIVQGSAGLTGNGWDVGVCFRNTGPGTMKRVDVSGFVIDGTTPLNGSGVLLNLTMYRVNNTPGTVAPLNWLTVPQDYTFQFVDQNLNNHYVTQVNGLITISADAP